MLAGICLVDAACAVPAGDAVIEPGNPAAVITVKPEPRRPTLEETIRAWPSPVLRLGLAAGLPETLNPAFMDSGMYALVASLVHRRVFDVVSDIGVPEASGSSVCILHLRPGIVWPDGRPVDSTLVLRNFQEIYASGDTRTPYAGRLAGFRFAAGDKDSVVCTAPRPMGKAELAWRLDLPLFPFDAWQEWRKLPNPGTLGTGLRSMGDLKYFWRQDAKPGAMVFAGDYRVVSWTVNSLVLEKNPAPMIRRGEGDNHGKPSGPARIELVFFSSASGAFADLEAGKLGAVLPGPDSDAVQPENGKNSGLSVMEIRGSLARTVICRPGSAWAGTSLMDCLHAAGSRQGLVLWDNSIHEASVDPGKRTGPGLKDDQRVTLSGTEHSMPGKIRVLSGNQTPGWVKALVLEAARARGLEMDFLEPAWEDMAMELRFGRNWDLAVVGLDENQSPASILPLLEFQDPEGLGAGRYPGKDSWPGDWIAWASGKQSAMAIVARPPWKLWFRMP